MAQQKAVEPAVDEVDDLIDELQPGAKLLKGQYTITRYLNSGGFGITYLAKDSLDRDIVIKECFPKLGLSAQQGRRGRPLTRPYC